ncbi:MAG: DUF1326 domain-containing protein [Proteobacteria bacterium]|nr:DUF1326 domain-containing protein [Pseudomonadota bacterium]MCH9758912.1 DUF1326 domain-containing protein [Pseudomonadota bacterium]
MKWNIKGEVLLSCNCDVFCPCVISLGRARPSAGYCHSWWGINITEGMADGESLAGLRIGILLDVPGKMGEGGWTVALYIDENASATAYANLTQIFTGQAGGSLGILSLLVANVLGVERANLTFDQTADGWHMLVTNAGGKVADCAIAKQAGKNPDEDVVVTNSQYWVASDITVAIGKKSKVRAHGRIWDFSGQSAEYAAVNWSSDNG